MSPDEFKRTKIIATVGPASQSPKTLRAMIRAGVNVFRLNYSHGDAAEHRRTFETIRTTARGLDAFTAIMIDLQGPKIRVGNLSDGAMELEDGAEVSITTRRVRGGNGVISTTYKQLPGDVKPGDRILLDDGLMELRVLNVQDKDVLCEIIKGGTLKQHKGMNLPGVKISAPSLTRKDFSDLRQGLALGADFIAMSFVRSGEDMKKLRRRVNAAGNGPKPQLIAKIERPEAITKLDDILDHGDGVMVARGDLGVEMPPEQVPELQKWIIERANRRGKRVITATQMLESMVHSPRPTRAEASDVANAVLDGTGAVMLSAETSVGAYPVETVAMMVRIVRAAESRLLEHGADHFPPPRPDLHPHDFSAPAADAAVRVANEVGARAVLAFTQSGTTAELVSKYRPRCIILGGTLHHHVARRMSLTWGVHPVLFDRVASTESLVADVDERLLQTKLVKWGDTVVITAGVPVGRAGTTNTIKIHRIGHND